MYIHTYILYSYKLNLRQDLELNKAKTGMVKLGLGGGGGGWGGVQYLHKLEQNLPPLLAYRH
jgi:hypothetical protein